MSFFFQEMLWTSHQSSCCWVVRSFQEKGLQHVQSLFCLETDDQVWELQSDRAHREMLMKPVLCWSLLSRKAEQNPLARIWIAWFPCISQAHVVKERTDYLESTEHLQLLVCGSSWVIMVVSTRKPLSHSNTMTEVSFLKISEFDSCLLSLVAI